MTKLEILQAELTRLNLEVLTDVGETLRKKQRRINVIILAIARITGTVVGGTPGPQGDKGAKGDKGENGSIGNDGIQGPEGPKGEKGNKGNVGEKGEQGEKGFDARLLSGKILYPDVQFENGDNTVYHYGGQAYSTITRVASPSGTPKVSGNCLKFTHDSLSQILADVYVGFYQPINSRANATFIQKFKANLPKGLLFNSTSNDLGTGFSLTFLTSNAGTGKWQDYIVEIKCGASGTFQFGGHIWISGTQPTPSAPLIWYLSDATVYDVDSVEPNLSPVFANNADATAGGLMVGKPYRTATGISMVVF